MKIFQFFNQLICASSVNEFSKEQSKEKQNKTKQNKRKNKTKQNKTEQTSIVYHKHYCYRGFLADSQ